MIKNLHPNKLYHFVWHKGPYIVFYSNNEDETNQNILNFIRQLDSQYKKLNVFEIEWKEQLKYNYYSNIQMMNTVYLYSNGKQIIKNFEPSKNNLIDLFDQAVRIHNEKVCSKVENLGIKTLNKLKFNSYVNNQTKIKLIERFDMSLTTKRIYYLQNIIQHSNKSYIEKVDNIKSKLLSKKKNDYNSNNIILDSHRHVQKYIGQINNYSTSEKPWFNDVEISDLPSDILFDSSLKDVSSENKNKEISKMNIDFTLHEKTKNANKNIKKNSTLRIRNMLKNKHLKSLLKRNSTHVSNSIIKRK